MESIGTDKTFSSKYGANKCPDKSANGMFSYAKSKGMAWDTIPDIVGLALHRDGHVGYTVGGYAVQWRGFNYGCVKTKIAGRGWKYWYRLPFIDYNDGSNVIIPTEVALSSHQLEKGMVGTDVKAMQELLMQLGYELPKYGADSDFGDETEKAVIAFQKTADIKQDGKYGAETHEALMDAVADDDEGKKEEEPEDTSAFPVEPEAPAEPKPVGTTVVIVADGGGKVNVRVGHDTSYKPFCTDFLTKKMKVNEGEIPQYYVENSHPAIVTAEMFDLVQQELDRRKEQKTQQNGTSIFSGKIMCGCCGAAYGSKV